MYRFHSDDGHGWLQVPTREVHALGIAQKISTCSYQSRDRKTSYLEEDCDLSVFCRAKGMSPGENRDIVDVVADGGWIRNLPSFDNSFGGEL